MLPPILHCSPTEDPELSHHQSSYWFSQLLLSLYVCYQDGCQGLALGYGRVFLNHIEDSLWISISGMISRSQWQWYARSPIQVMVGIYRSVGLQLGTKHRQHYWFVILLSFNSVADRVFSRSQWIGKAHSCSTRRLGQYVVQNLIQLRTHVHPRHVLC